MASTRVGRRSRWDRDSSDDSSSSSPPPSRTQRSRSSSLERHRTSRSPAWESRHIEEPRVFSPSSGSPGRRFSRWSPEYPSRRRARSRSYSSSPFASPTHGRTRSRSRSRSSSASPTRPHHHRHRRHDYRHRSRSASYSQSLSRSPIYRSRSGSSQYERTHHNRSRSTSLSWEGHRESRSTKYPRHRHHSRSASYSRSSSMSPIHRSRSRTPQYESRLHSYSRSTSRPDHTRSGPPRSAHHRSQRSRSPCRRRFSRSPLYRSRSPFPTYGSMSPNDRGPPCPTQRSCSPEECTESRGLEQTEHSVSSGLQPRYGAPAPTYTSEFREASTSPANRATAHKMPAAGGDNVYVKGEPLSHNIDTTDPELLRLATQGEIGGVVFDGRTLGSYPRRDLRKPDTQAVAPRSGHSRSRSPRSRRQETKTRAPVLRGGKGSWCTDELEFFWGSQSPFSQHHKVQFSLEGLTFNCSEQYMMYHKAMMFGAQDVAQRIMQTTDSAEMKRLGRLVSNFDAAAWDGVCYEVVKRANMAKFSQNPQLLRQLKETHPRLLVEASPVDRKWGIGLASDHPLATQPERWPGENLLGKILTEVRDALMHSA